MVTPRSDRTPEDVLLQVLRDVAGDAPISIGAFDRRAPAGSCSSELYRLRFGSWGEACRRAGVRMGAHRVLGRAIRVCIEGGELLIAWTDEEPDGVEVFGSRVEARDRAVELATEQRKYWRAQANRARVLRLRDLTTLADARTRRAAQELAP